MTSMSVEEYFAEAADRLQGGETIEQIIVDYPREVRSELQELLAVVEYAGQVAAIAPPRPAPANGIAARILFAQRAAELRAELEAANSALDGANDATLLQPETHPQPTARTQPRRQVSVAGWWHRLTERWGMPAPTPVMRLAPLTVLLAIIYLLTSTLVVAAKESLPGNPVYPVKLWMLEQGVATAPVQQKAEARWLVDRTVAGDVARLAEQLQSTPDAAPVVVESIQQFRGFDEDLLLVGDLRVIPWHQPAGAGPDEWYPISIEGALEPGASVSLRYQIVPGATDVVRGIELIVLQSPVMSTPAPTPTPTADPATSVHCQRMQPPNWVTYSVRPGESLRDIAVRAQTTSAELRRVNCLTEGSVPAGTTIFVPVSILGRAPAARPPALATAFPTRVAPTVTPLPATPTRTPLPPTSAPTLTPTSETASPEPTTVGPGGDPTSSATPIDTTPSTPGATPTAGTTSTPAVTEAPPTPVETETPVAPSTPPSTPVETETRVAQPTATAPADADPSPTAIPPTERPAADTATPLPTQVTEATPTAAPTTDSEAGSANATPTQPPPTATQPPPPPPTATQPPPPPTATQPPPPPTATQPPPPPTATQQPPPPPTATPTDSSGEDDG